MEKEADLDSLARMVASGFSSLEQNMNERFDSVEGRLDGLETRMDGVESELRGVNQRLDTVVEILDDHSRRIKDLELAS